MKTFKEFLLETPNTQKRLKESLEDYTTMRIKGRQWAGNGMGTDPGSHELCMGKGARRRIPTGITIHGMRSGGYIIKHYDDKVGTADSFNTAKEKAIAHHKKMLGESVELEENWQRAILRKHGSVKPGHWNGKKFVTDLSKADAAGFDHERCKTINAQVEVNGKVVAGGLQKPIEESN